MNLKDKVVTVVGLGLRTGVEVVKFLVDQGAEVIVTDAKQEADLAEELNALADYDLQLDLGGHSPQLILKSDLIVVSPGVPADIPLLEQAEKEDIEIIGEIELAYRFGVAPIVGITGTNGKTTTTTLLGKVAQSLDKKVTVGGNIGRALIKDLPELAEDDLAIAEISSFQLEWVDQFKADIALILNITPDHLNRHHDFAEYATAKKRLLANQGQGDYAVLNYDDPVVKEFASDTTAEVVFFSQEEELTGGVFVEDSWIVSDLNESQERIIPVAELGLVGPHNLENVLGVVTCSLLLGIDKEELVSSLRSFSGIEHRLEKFATIDGVSYINDSKATNPAAAIKGLQSFSDSVILIAGGMDKESDFADFASEIPGRVKNVILLGETADDIKAELEKIDYKKIVNVTSIQQAAQEAFELAKAGDVVLLSPACASWDMFSSYKERGNLFKTAVGELRRS
ncbi:MAG: UDP-N-acetylmuramoyl-L-alanine--D-glutamate ligase [Bacillota bacterium]